MNAEQILEHARNLVSGDRRAQHGDAHTNFGNIAIMWSAFMAIRRDPSASLSRSDVADMMELMKLARRQTGSVNEDDAVDGSAYAAFSGEFADD